MGYNWGSRAASIEAGVSPRKINEKGGALRLFVGCCLEAVQRPVQPSDRTNEPEPMRPEKPRNGPTQARPASDTTLRSRGAGNARSCASTIAVLKAGRRESRVPMTPAV